MSRHRRIAGGVLGAAVTGAAVSARHHWSRLARRRADADAAPKDLGQVPPGVAWSVTADDGVRLSAEVIEPSAGARAGLTVVLVHGFALDRRCWHFQRRALTGLTEPAVRVVLYDQRSHGRSERATRPSCTIAQLGADLGAVLRTLAPEGRVVLVGHSMGGMAIMALAEGDPELFSRSVVGTVLLCTSAGDVADGGLPGAFLNPRNPITRLVGALAAVRPALVERARRLIRDLVWGVTGAYSYGDRGVPRWLVDFVHTMISANAVDALVDFVGTLSSHQRVHTLPGLADCRTLIVAAEADRIIPVRHSEVIAAELPDATLVRLPGAGHMAMLEQPEAVDRALVALLAEFSRPVGWLRRLRKWA